MTYTVQCCRAGWFVRRNSDGIVVSHGHATRESAEAYVFDMTPPPRRHQ